MEKTASIRALVLVTTALVACPLAARAQTAEQRMSAIEQQIKALQDELRRVRQDLSQRDAQVRAARQEAAQARAEARARPAPAGQGAGAQAGVATAAPPAGGPGQNQAGVSPASSPGPHLPGSEGAQQASSSSPKGSFQVGGVTVTLGGFVEAAGIFRTSNETADIISNFNTGIPYPYQTNYHTTEFRGSARQSRLSLLLQGEPDAHQKIAGFFETDFLGAAPTANSNESNSYNPRLRQAYIQYDNSDWGLHVLGGQAWSLLTMTKVGITPRQEDLPLTIDAQYVPGFMWTRQPQLRVAKDFDDHRLWLAASLESPQTVFYTGPNGAGVRTGTATTTYPGTGAFSSGTNYSDDVAPDIIAKVAYDPGFGHFEGYGLLRFMQDRVSNLGRGQNNIVPAGGGGAGAIIPLMGKKLELEGRFLAGVGIGRYGSAQLPDAVLGAQGRPTPLPEVEALAGLVYHPTEQWDLYGYVGTEQIGRRSFTAGGKGYGYGSPLYDNSGCEIELASASTCVANTSGVVQGTLGAWWRFLSGPYGTVQAGAQYSYTQRSIFRGVGGNPDTDQSTVLVSLRYLPFQ